MSATAAIRITGALAEHARHYVNPNGSAGLTLLLSGAGPDSAQVEAHRFYGQGPAAQIAACSAARQLRAGSRVTVHAAAWRIRRDRLVLSAVSHIEHHPAPARRATSVNEELSA
jgi:hypothetical protein